MNTQDKDEREIFNFEGQVRSSAELLWKFQIKREKILGNNIKKNKPPTTAAVTSKPKGFDNQIKGRNQGTFSIANHSTSDQGQGKNANQKKCPIEATNMQRKKHKFKTQWSSQCRQPTYKGREIKFKIQRIHEQSQPTYKEKE
ncbi:hypothetical protein SESBI_49535 [Sesbania bispinosa]|nr:hypothetical protein SESBI_49535 [Sesbania bispinosa]